MPEETQQCVGFQQEFGYAPITARGPNLHAFPSWSFQWSEHVFITGKKKLRTEKYLLTQECDMKFKYQRP